MRLEKANFAIEKRANRAAALEILIHGVKYSFPVELGSLSEGVPTALSALIHEKKIIQNGDEVFVWPYSKEKKEGKL